MTVKIIKHEVNALVVGQRDKDGYINATALCKAAGKVWNNYNQSQPTKDFLAELVSFSAIPLNELIQTKQGQPANGGGTWVHPQIATHLAQWASPKFAVMVSQWVAEWIAKEPQKPVVAISSQSAQALTDWMTVATLFKVPTHYAQIEGVKMAQTVYGIDYSPLLLQAPAMNDIPETDVMLEPTELAPHIGEKSAIAANKRLAVVGLQVKYKGEWEPTALGIPMSSKHAWHKGGKSGYNLKWVVSAVVDHLKSYKK